MTIILVCLAGGWLFGVACFALGCIYGHGVGEREIARMRIEADKAHCDASHLLSDGTDISRMTMNEIVSHLDRLRQEGRSG